MPLSPIFFFIFPLKAAYTSHREIYTDFFSILFYHSSLFFQLTNAQRKRFRSNKNDNFSFLSHLIYNAANSIQFPAEYFQFSLDKPLNILYNDLVVRDN